MGQAHLGRALRPERHQQGHAGDATAGFRAYNGDWLHPVKRNDWIFTPSATVDYRVDDHVNVNAGYSYDWADSLDPGRPYREFTRHLGWVTVQYRF